jgi:Family of unknown function (DUF6599)
LSQGFRPFWASILLVVLMLTAGAGCHRKAAGKSGSFPASGEVSGWTKTGETRTFDAANLWRYIDGEAERYLKVGVQSVSTCDYKYEDKTDAVADIYTMTSAEGAGKIFESEPQRNAKPVTLGDDARLYGQSLVFRKGRYLTRIVAYNESPEVQPAILALGRAVAERLEK